MPSSVEAVFFFVAVIVPGFLLIGGYNRTRAHTLPPHDFYLLAQAVVASLLWLLRSPERFPGPGSSTPPTAWDALWERALGGEWAAVEITLKSGEPFYVLFDNGSEVGLSPGPRYLFFDTEYDWDENDELEVKENDGIYIDASEVCSVRLEHVQRPKKP
jgi:Family of unknown function (DUF6338)